jgi:hypothetical protein
MASEDLFTPTLQGHPVSPARKLPWRSGSLFWPAFFGGSLAVGVLAWVNGRRLGLAPARQRLILPATAFASLLSVAAFAYFMTEPHDDRIWGRRAVQACGVVLYLALVRILQPADRRHQLFDGHYASLWIPGLLSILGSAAVILFASAAVAVALGPASR